MYRAKTGIYFITKAESTRIIDLPADSNEKKKWDKREVRIIEDNIYRTPHGVKTEGTRRPNRSQRRKALKKGQWRDGNQKNFSENKTKKVLKEEQRKRKRKQNRR